MNAARRDERIIVRAPNWVGDAVMATPLFASLRRTRPQAHITCLCRPLVADTFRHSPDIDRVIELDETFGRSGWRMIRRNAWRLRKESFDLAISLPNSLSSALMIFLARIPQRVGYRGDWRRAFLTESMPFPPNGARPHRVDSYLELLSLVAEPPIIERRLNLVIDPRSATEVGRALVANGISPARRYVALAPGAAQPNKMWMPDRFAELARRLMSDGLPVVLVGGPSDRELCDSVTRVTGTPDPGRSGPGSGQGRPLSARISNLAGSGSLLVTAEIIRRAAVFVGNDSGLAHIAAAVGTPAVVLSGPGDPTEVAPYSRCAITLAKTLFCKPCYKNYCWRKDKPLECLGLIAVEEVHRAVGRYLDRTTVGGAHSAQDG